MNISLHSTIVTSMVCVPTPVAFPSSSFDVQERSNNKQTFSPSLLYMCVISKADVNSNLAIPSKHFLRCG